MHLKVLPEQNSKQDQTQSIESERINFQDNINCKKMFPLTYSDVFHHTGLLPPKSLSFSEVTSRSFRTSWISDGVDVLSFMVRFRPAADITGDYISLVVPHDTTSTVLPNLTPLTTYEVNVIAQYDKGDSFPLTGEETTLEGICS